MKKNKSKLSFTNIYSVIYYSLFALLGYQTFNITYSLFRDNPNISSQISIIVPLLSVSALSVVAILLRKGDGATRLFYGALFGSMSFLLSNAFSVLYFSFFTDFTNTENWILYDTILNAAVFLVSLLLIVQYINRVTVSNS